MIVDTSALVAVANEEEGWERIANALVAGGGRIPAPVLVEFERVMAGARGATAEAAHLLILLYENGVSVEAFSDADGKSAALANARYGTGNGQGGTLNMLDLMVYAVAQRLDMPILCTGRDFAVTDARIHPASRTR